MRTKRVLFTAAVVVFLLVGATALVTPIQAAKPGPQPGCNEYCKLVVHPGGHLTCYFVGCTADGSCLYKC